MKIISRLTLIIILACTYNLSAFQMASQDTAAISTDFSMGFSVGSVTIDGVNYSQISLRPDIPLGKVGLGLDIPLYIDPDGNIREDNWDEPGDLLEKILYVRYGKKGDPVYIKAGSLANVTLGYGMLMSNYSNMIEYPTVIRPGLEFNAQLLNGKVKVEGILNNFRELDVPGIIGARVSYSPIPKLSVGVTMVSDGNQYAGLRDKDEDDVPDVFDDFPDDKDESLDSDGDGVPDGIDPDRDGNGYTDNTQDSRAPNNDPDIATIDDRLKPAPFSLADATRSISGMGFDIGFQAVKNAGLDLTIYSQFAQLRGDVIDEDGTGFVPLGFRAIFGPLTLQGEYRQFKKAFVAGFFNTTYEIDRATTTLDANGDLKPFTKEEKIKALVTDDLKGVFVGATSDLFGMLNLRASYQRMTQDTVEINSIVGNLDLNVTSVPKIKMAGAYYYQENVEELFKLSEGTALGFRFGYEISQGAMLIIDYRTTYRDKDGDGKIDSDTEGDKTTNIVTQFTF